MKLLWAGFLAAVLCAAQVHHHAPPLDGSVDLANLPAPEWIDGVGQAHFAITTTSPDAQKWFDQGLALMHCFWDYEALRAYEQALRADPQCAMCHWGLAQALDFRGGADDQARSELQKAQALATHASDRERAVITASVTKNPKPLEAAARAHPDDVELHLMLSQSLKRGYKHGKPDRGAQESQAILLKIMQEHPDNAAAQHFWIHAMEGSPHPERALDSANKLASLAPASSHMVHMPGHIYYRTGDYERARQSFLAAEQVDLKYMDREHVAPINDWNYAHNLSYMVADCAEEGRYQEALKHARSLMALAKDPEHTSNPGFYVLQIAPTETRLAIRYGDWDRVIANPLQFGVPDGRLAAWERNFRDGLLAFAQGMKAAKTGHEADARNASSKLDSIIGELKGDDGGYAPERARKILITSGLELRAAIASEGGQVNKAIKLLKQSDTSASQIGYSEPPQYARPPAEALAATYLRAGKYAEARRWYAKALEDRPKSGFALYGIAQAWDKEGNREQARAAYQAFLAAWSNADPDLPQVKDAQAKLE